MHNFFQYFCLYLQLMYRLKKFLRLIHQVSFFRDCGSERLGKAFAGHVESNTAIFYYDFLYTITTLWIPVYGAFANMRMKMMKRGKDEAGG